ncbi:hypothetical protein QU670_11810 [Actinomyces massiliensis]|uniref:hypothetical protein n=1 Tax=Actinomyces massiliensis TaxID=461393 RepID=UPI0018E198CF|nr:hypothetical protein [Actinomyces massiliensis]WLD71133.1 hypothetical protein QU670_11810 [Actinomyces massiliensis]
MSSDVERACSRGSGGIFPGEAGVADVGGFVVDGEYGVASVAGESADVAGWADAGEAGAAVGGCAPSDGESDREYGVSSIACDAPGASGAAACAAGLVGDVGDAGDAGDGGDGCDIGDVGADGASAAAADDAERGAISEERRTCGAAGAGAGADGAECGAADEAYGGAGAAGDAAEAGDGAGAGAGSARCLRGAVRPSAASVRGRRPGGSRMPAVWGVSEFGAGAVRCRRRV